MNLLVSKKSWLLAPSLALASLAALACTWAVMEPEALRAAFDADGASYTHEEWGAQDPADEQNAAVAAMLSEGHSANFVTFTAGTTLAEGASATSGAGEHMTSFDYAYKIEAVRDWLFQQ